MKRFAIFLTKRRNSGFTLVEMVVSVALLAVLMVGIMLFISPVLKTFNDDSRDLVAENITTCVQNYITQSMRDATNVVIFANTNEDSVRANCMSTINQLKAFCENPKTSLNDTPYNMWCLSLRFDSSDGRYYLYREKVVTNSGDTADPFNSAERYSVFSKCLYNDLYTRFRFEKAIDLDKAGETDPPRLYGTLSTTMSTYSDAAQTNTVFYGTGLYEFREITREYVRKGSGSTFKLKLYDGINPDLNNPVDAVDTANGSDGSRDMYIFYTEYNLNSTKLP